MRRANYVGDLPGLGGGYALPWPPILPDSAVDSVNSSLNVQSNQPGVVGPKGTANVKLTGPSAPSPYTAATVDYSTTDGSLLTTQDNNGDPSWSPWKASSPRFLTTVDNGSYAVAAIQVGSDGKLVNPRAAIFGGVGIAKKFSQIGITNNYTTRDPRGWRVYGGASATGPWTLTDVVVLDGNGNALKNNPGTEFRFPINPGGLTFDFYKVEFTHANVPPSGNFNWIDIGGMQLYEDGASYNVQFKPVTESVQPNKLTTVLRAGNCSSTPTLQVTRNGTDWSTTQLTLVATLGDGSKVFVAETYVSSQGAGTSVAAKLTMPAGSTIYGFTCRGSG